ncbi:hypothetical protein PF010_g9383 [Phytophthora fragariae]|uniref:Tc1-like transposase DDE domain-containing protein n=1 Tax=Phytophthora fragariae TaxID=53985 RepID=A0A6G0LCL2_9STRA|nr:hypothetical protein PF010_g9383 [Phytophthora fragariae]
MTLALHEMGFHHLKGETRNIIAESAGNVDFRKVYIERKLANRVALCSGRLFRPTRAGIVFSPKATIDILLGNVEFYRHKEEYMATKIAVKYGHLVFFTPPYLPAAHRAILGDCQESHRKGSPKNGGDIVAKVRAGLEACEGDWLKVYRHVQKHEDAFDLDLQN